MDLLPGGLHCALLEREEVLSLLSKEHFEGDPHEPARVPDNGRYALVQNEMNLPCCAPSDVHDPRRLEIARALRVIPPDLFGGDVPRAPLDLRVDPREILAHDSETHHQGASDQQLQENHRGKT